MIITRKRKNCDCRRDSIVGGDYVVSEDGTLTADTSIVVSAVPLGSVITAVRVVGQNTSATGDITVTVGTTDLTPVTVTASTNEVKKVAESEIYIDANTEISFKSSVELTDGTLTILVDYIEFNCVTGLKVEPVIRG